MAKSKPREFNVMIDQVAGQTLVQLVQGKSGWRDIIVTAAIQILYWAENERPKLDPKRR